MKNISELTVSNEYHYKIDDIPVNYLLTNKALKQIQDTFNFADANPNENIKGSFTFTNGQFELEHKVLIIFNLIIEPSKIILIVLGNTKEADLAYKTICDIITVFDYDNIFKKAKPLLIVNRTNCTLDLDFDLTNVFNSEFLSFISKNIVNKASNKIIEAYTREFSINIDMFYNIIDEEVKANNIKLNSSIFSIAHRLDTNLKDRRYYTSSPLDSDTHFKCLEELEKIFKKS